MMKITRNSAIQILDKATDKDDPFWENIIDEWYDEKTDTWPTIGDVFKAIGITKEEYKNATGHDMGN